MIKGNVQVAQGIKTVSYAASIDNLVELLEVAAEDLKGRKIYDADMFMDRTMRHVMNGESPIVLRIVEE